MGHTLSIFLCGTERRSWQSKGTGGLGNQAQLRLSIRKGPCIHKCVCIYIYVYHSLSSLSPSLSLYRLFLCKIHMGPPGRTDGAGITHGPTVRDRERNPPPSVPPCTLCLAGNCTATVTHARQITTEGLLAACVRCRPEATMPTPGAREHQDYDSHSAKRQRARRCSIKESTPQTNYKAYWFGVLGPGLWVLVLDSGFWFWVLGFGPRVLGSGLGL